MMDNLFQPDFQVEIAMDPVAKGRPRMCKNGHAYTPEKTRRAEDQMRWAVAQALGSRRVPVVHGPLYVEVEFSFVRPKSVKRKSHTVKPDLDNLVKSLDSLNGLVWQDDSQIESIRAHKFYSDRARIMIRVWETEPREKESRCAS